MPKRREIIGKECGRVDFKFYAAERRKPRHYLDFVGGLGGDRSDPYINPREIVKRRRSWECYEI